MEGDNERPGRAPFVANDVVISDADAVAIDRHVRHGRRRRAAINQTRDKSAKGSAILVKKKEQKKIRKIKERVKKNETSMAH